MVAGGAAGMDEAESEREEDSLPVSVSDVIELATSGGGPVPSPTLLVSVLRAGNTVRFTIFRYEPGNDVLEPDDVDELAGNLARARMDSTSAGSILQPSRCSDFFFDDGDNASVFQVPAS